MRKADLTVGEEYAAECSYYGNPAWGDRSLERVKLLEVDGVQDWTDTYGHKRVRRGLVVEVLGAMPGYEPEPGRRVLKTARKLLAPWAEYERHWAERNARQAHHEATIAAERRFDENVSIAMFEFAQKLGFDEAFSNRLEYPRVGRFDLDAEDLATLLVRAGGHAMAGVAARDLSEALDRELLIREEAIAEADAAHLKAMIDAGATPEEASAG